MWPSVSRHTYWFFSAWSAKLTPDYLRWSHKKLHMQSALGPEEEHAVASCDPKEGTLVICDLNPLTEFGGLFFTIYFWPRWVSFDACLQANEHRSSLFVIISGKTKPSAVWRLDSSCRSCSFGGCSRENEFQCSICWHFIKAFAKGAWCELTSKCLLLFFILIMTSWCIFPYVLCFIIQSHVTHIVTWWTMMRLFYWFGTLYYHDKQVFRCVWPWLTSAWLSVLTVTSIQYVRGWTLYRLETSFITMNLYRH